MNKNDTKLEECPYCGNEFEVIEWEDDECTMCQSRYTWEENYKNNQEVGIIWE